MLVKKLKRLMNIYLKNGHQTLSAFFTAEARRAQRTIKEKFSLRAPRLCGEILYFFVF